MVAQLFLAFLPSHLTYDSWSHWSCTLLVAINFQTGPKISKFFLKQLWHIPKLIMNFKWLYIVCLTSWSHKMDPFFRSYNLLSILGWQIDGRTSPALFNYPPCSTKGGAALQLSWTTNHNLCVLTLLFK